jgi:2-keto-4-pentenoate hydratase/2-oxohepta-3-ene-1,7-dioic acid hydratase in catechol pathway
MRLLSFEIDGRASFGIATADGVIDAGARLGLGGLREALLAGALDRVRELAGRAPDHALADIAFLPVIPDAAAKIWCTGINSLPHIAEMGRERPEHPVLFVRFADSVVGHGAPLVRPAASVQYDYEGELAVVIGRRARHVRRDDALDHVAGFSCFNDGSVRDFQWHSPQWTAGKNFHASAAFGPWLVTRDEQPDPRALHLRTRLNGATVQDASVAELCFTVADIVAYCSIWTQLEPGDVLVTGTPGGVGAGRNPPMWLKPGDVVEVDIAGVGVLRNTVVDEERN